MVHGSTGYFLERSRCARRTSLLTFVLGLPFLAFLLALQVPTMRRMVPEATRFGFEGPEQYVRRIVLEQRGHTSTLADVGQIQPRSAGRGGAAPDPSRGRVGQPRPVTPRAGGSGQDGGDVPLRSISRLGGVPVFQSEELIIDRLVKPEYPPTLLEHNIEGKVTLQALVDTVGQVIEVQLLASTGEMLFERAAEEAVRQCRFRPYRPGGEASEVYAVFRFSFKIY